MPKRDAGPDSVTQLIELTSLDSISTIDADGFLQRNKALEGPTRGDVSNAAAGSEPGFDAAFVEYQSPSADPEGVAGRAHIVTLDGHQLLEPPDDPDALYQVYRLSSFLAPLVDAMLNNVYRTEYSIQSILNKKEEKAHEQIADALDYLASGGDFMADIKPPTKSEIKKAAKDLERRHRRERIYLHAFLEEAVAAGSFDNLRELLGLDLEVTGNAYWEVIRDIHNRPVRFNYMPARTTRAAPQGPELVEVEKPVRRTVMSWSKTRQVRRFRRYAQRSRGGISCWFKEFGDPRVMSRKTGKYYKSIEHMYEVEWQDRRDEKERPLPATEVYHFRLPHGGDPVYGRPRWTGVFPSLKGSRDLDEENLKQVRDEAIPNLLLLIAGGRAGKESVARLRQAVKERKEGRKGILVLDAWMQGQAPTGPTAQTQIHPIKLKSEQTSDMLFQKYDERNEDKANGAFRMPRALLGKDLGQNRATTLAMLRFAQDQVFSPARNRIDGDINTLLMYCDIQYSVYRTNTIPAKDPELLAQMVKTYVESGVLTTDEAREQAGPTLNTEYEGLEGIWADLPKQLITTVLQTKNKELAAALLQPDRDALRTLSEALAKVVEQEPQEPADGTEEPDEEPKAAADDAGSDK